MPDYCVKISAKSDCHPIHNLSSNPTANFSESDNNCKITWKTVEQKSKLNSRSIANIRGYKIDCDRYFLHSFEIE